MDVVLAHFEVGQFGVEVEDEGRQFAESFVKARFVGVQEEGGLQNQPGYQPGELRVLQIDARRSEERALLDAVEDYQQFETGGENARV